MENMETKTNKVINFKLQIPLYLQATINGVQLQYSVVNFKEDELTIRIWNKSESAGVNKIENAIRKFSTLIAEQEEMKLISLTINLDSLSTLVLSK